METIIKKLGGLDKIAHFGIGSAICSFLVFICLLQDIQGPLHWSALGYCIIGTAVAMALELIKEYLIDAYPDKKDILATALGCAAVWVSVALGILFNILQAPA